MPWFVIYDVSDGTIQGTADFALPDSAYAEQGRAQMQVPDGTITNGRKVDLDTLQLIPDPTYKPSQD